ncbi:cupin domain-containing protein [Haloarchaeobius baliensis]|uniref:cupin domain-containing protein n=1 Tax=Haloarchaeobius baliensis TaxID=1670458 RepID=UPI003F88148E
MSAAHTDADAGRILDFEGFPGRWEILETAGETGGERFKTRMELEERSELPPHRHPNAEESYEVLDGELEVQVEGEWSTLSAGERCVIPPGTVHAFRNPGPAEVVNVHRPAMRFEEFFRDFHQLKTERGVSMPPEGLESTILLAMLLVEYDAELTTTSPPYLVCRLLRGLGRLLGYRLPS